MKLDDAIQKLSQRSFLVLSPNHAGTENVVRLNVAVEALKEQALARVPTHDKMPSSSDERYLRRLLFSRCGMAHTYYDDGEAQGHELDIKIDFMREPVATIEAKLRELNMARLELGKPAAAPQPATDAEQALENCRLFAARHRKEEWATVIRRFCAEGGAVGSPLRAAQPPAEPAAPADLDYHCTIKCESCGRKNYFTRRQLEESHLNTSAAAPSVAPEPWVDTTIMRKLASVLLPVSEKALTECCDEIDRLRVNQARALLTDEQIDAAYRKYGTGRPDGFAAAVRELEAAAHGISAAAIGEKP